MCFCVAKRITHHIKDDAFVAHHIKDDALPSGTTHPTVNWNDYLPGNP
jgi:hypothetical protein